VIRRRRRPIIIEDANQLLPSLPHCMQLKVGNNFLFVFRLSIRDIELRLKWNCGSQ